MDLSRARVWLDRVLHPEVMRTLHENVQVYGGDGTLDELPGCHAMIISPNIQVTADLLDAVGPQLRVIARPGIGVDNIDVQAASQRGIAVVNVPDAPTESTAEHAIGLILALAKGIVISDRIMRAAGFMAARNVRSHEVKGKTLGIIGLGRIGTRVAEIAHVLGMNVVAYDPYSSKIRARSTNARLVDDLDELLREADFVTLHCALTPETRDLINAERIARMKPGSYLINCSRGAIVDEAALIEAVSSGHLAGAGIDVFDPEPPLAGNPLFTLENVIVTPHVASATEEGRKRAGHGAVQQVLQVLRDECPPYLVDPEMWEHRRQH